MSTDGFETGLSLARAAGRAIDREIENLNKRIEELHLQLDVLILRNNNLHDALGMIVANDKTVYQHHERRPSDGKMPSDHGGTIWRTPAEIAKDALLWARKTCEGEVRK